MDFGDLKGDEKIQETLKTFHASVDNIEKIVEEGLSEFDYGKLSIEDKVQTDLFFAYVLNATHWMFLRSQGVDPQECQVPEELNRIKEYMVKFNQAHDRNTKRPHVNKQVAERFVKHGINYSAKPTTSKSEDQNIKKRKRTD